MIGVLPKPVLRTDNKVENLFVWDKEIMSLSDRIYVIYEGRAVGEFRKEDATEENLGILMMGGKLA